MTTAQFDEKFLRELRAILESDSVTYHYDNEGRFAAKSTQPYTHEWQLLSLGFAPGPDRTRVIARFRVGSHDVTATIDAADFAELIGKKTRNRAFNSSRYSDLAVIVSLRIEEQIISRDPSSVPSGEVRIGHI